MDHRSALDKSMTQLLDAFDDAWSVEYLKENEDRFLKDLKIITSLIPKGGAIADLGAAPFATSISLVHLGYKVVAYDIKPDRFSYLDTLNIQVNKLDLDNWKELNSEEQFDLVVLTEVFEHLRGDLINVMDNVKKILKRDGKVYLTTPNLRSAMGMYKFFFKGIGYSLSRDLHHEWNKLNTIGQMGHVREYTNVELRHFFKKCGFKILEEKTPASKIGHGFKNHFMYTLEKISGLGSISQFILQKSDHS